MSEDATFRTRRVSLVRMGRFLVVAGTCGVAATLAANGLGLSPLLAGPAVAVVVAVLARREVVDAEYGADASALTERLTPVGGGQVRERRWPWSDVTSHALGQASAPARGPRKVLLLRLPDVTLRLREPRDAAGRDAHARFVDRVVGYVTGDVIPGSIGRAEMRGRDESSHRQPLTSGEAPQLRRTLADHPALPRPSHETPPMLDSVAGRLGAGMGALAIGGLLVWTALRGLSVDARLQWLFLLGPTGLWLGWRAIWRVPRG